MLRIQLIAQVTDPEGLPADADIPCSHARDAFQNGGIIGAQGSRIAHDKDVSIERVRQQLGDGGLGGCMVRHLFEPIVHYMLQQEGSNGNQQGKQQACTDKAFHQNWKYMKVSGCAPKAMINKPI